MNFVEGDRTQPWAPSMSFSFRMIARRRPTLTHLVYLGTLALLLYLLLLLSRHYRPLDFQAWNPAQQLPNSGGGRLSPCAASAGFLSGGRPAVPFHPPASCDGQTSVRFCSLVSGKEGPAVECGGEPCGSSLLGAVQDADSGLLCWKKFQSYRSLEEWTNSLLRPSSDSRKKKHFGFCLIGCGDLLVDTGGRLYDPRDDTILSPSTALQILLLPPAQVTGGRPPVRSSSSSDINFNLIFIDSVSRQHFFRSMPDTVNMFEELRKDSASGVTVLDFELLQALKSRTFETIQALFSGKVDLLVKPFGTMEMPPEPLKTEVLLKRLKEKGYSTLWMEDLCYLWEWGLAKDLLVLNNTLNPEQTWRRLQEALSGAGIDSLEVTYAMCKVLSVNGVPDGFHGPDALCLNGVHQHDYLLDYLALYQRAAARRGTPFFTFLETNVGHEDTGRRIQALDPSLRRHLKGAVELNNTLTVVFADHGNSYGAFMGESMEGRMELFHPHLFMLVPDGVAAVLGRDAMKALHVNQRRLVSHVDLHHMLRHLAGADGQAARGTGGLLQVIPASRTCHQVPRIMPSLCICQNFDMPVDNDDYHALFALMALGKVNHQIQRLFFQQTQQAGGEHRQGFGHCRRLSLWDFNNVKKSFSGTTISLKMDLLVPQESLEDSAETFHGAPGRPMEVFFVSMLVDLRGGNSSRTSVILETLDRITPYSQFSACADPAVRLQLCVCDVRANATHRSGQDPRRTGTDGALHSRRLGVTAEEFVAEGTQECLQLAVRKNDHGGVFSVANVCPGKVFHVVFFLQTEGMIVSDAMPRRESVYPGQEVLLAMAVRNAPKVVWEWSFTLHQRQEAL